MSIRRSINGDVHIVFPFNEVCRECMGTGKSTEDLNADCPCCDGKKYVQIKFFYSSDSNINDIDQDF